MIVPADGMVFMMLLTVPAGDKILYNLVTSVTDPISFGLKANPFAAAASNVSIRQSAVILVHDYVTHQ